MIKYQENVKLSDELQRGKPISAARLSRSTLEQRPLEC